MSYGPNFLDLYRPTADFVDKILRVEAGRHPGRTADHVRPRHHQFQDRDKALDLTVSQSILPRADEVIE